MVLMRDMAVNIMITKRLIFAAPTIDLSRLVAGSLSTFDLHGQDQTPLSDLGGRKPQNLASYRRLLLAHFSDVVRSLYLALAHQRAHPLLRG